MSADGKSCIFITGGGAGIGLATAKLFAKNGWFVGIYDYNETTASEALDAIGVENGCCGPVDVRDPDSIQQALDDFGKQTGGKMDILFNNAGVLTVNPFEDVTLEQHHAEIDVNAKGVVNCSHLAFPMLRDTPGARMISMASASAAYGVPDFNTYSATKFFVRGLTEALNIEWKRHDIRVCDLMPPFVNTKMVTDVGKNTAIENMGVNLTAEDVASTVWEAAHGSKIHYPMTGQFKFLMLVMKLMPTSVTRGIMAHLTGY